MTAMTGAAQSNRPRTVRDYFMLLPQTYFAIESCNTDEVRDCRPFKTAYLERFLKIEDVKNGFLTGDGDGSQESFEMALFRRPNDAPIVGLHVFGEWGDTYRFLEYRRSRWRDISKIIIPNYRRRNAYELPRLGTTVTVYARLYHLVWKNGRFLKKR